MHNTLSELILHEDNKNLVVTSPKALQRWKRSWWLVANASRRLGVKLLLLSVIPVAIGNVILAITMPKSQTMVVKIVLRGSYLCHTRHNIKTANATNNLIIKQHITVSIFENDSEQLLSSFAWEFSTRLSENLLPYGMPKATHKILQVLQGNWMRPGLPSRDTLHHSFSLEMWWIQRIYCIPSQEPSLIQWW